MESEDPEWDQFIRGVDTQMTESSKRKKKVVENEDGAEQEMEFDDEDDQQQGYMTDEMGELHYSSDEEPDRYKRPPQFNSSSQYGNVSLELYMTFPTLKVFKDAVKDYTIAAGRPLKILKNDSNRCSMKCENEQCNWSIFCSWSEVHGCFQIKRFRDDHSCGRSLKNKMADQNWVAEKLVPRLRVTPKMTVRDAFTFMAESYQVQLDDSKLNRALRIARDLVEGSEKEQYSKLRDYCAEILRSNPNSTAILRVDRADEASPPIFSKLYICFDACKSGALAGCRQLIGLDGCFLKGYYGGTLLTAVTQDGNQAFYVIAYALVEQETKETWTFFLTKLFEDIGNPSVEGWEFISDMQKGLLPAMQELCPDVNHRFCVKHLEANLWKQWRITELRIQLWRCAKSKTMVEFERNYNHLRSINANAWTYLNKFPPETWCRAAFKNSSKNWALVNNISEQFNASIVKFRGKPILTMLEDIRTYLMTKMNKSRKQISRYSGPLTPAAQAKLEMSKKDSNNWIAFWASDDDAVKFQVTHIVQKSWKFVVDIRDFTCSCGEWDLCGIPCQHAVACFRYNNMLPEDFVSSHYAKETWKCIYQPFIKPLRGPDQWEKTPEEPIMHPQYTRGGGRPKKKRSKANDIPHDPYKARKEFRPFECRKCGVVGHNSRTCKGTIAKQQNTKKTRVSNERSQEELIK